MKEPGFFGYRIVSRIWVRRKLKIPVVIPKKRRYNKKDAYAAGCAGRKGRIGLEERNVLEHMNRVAPQIKCLSERIEREVNSDLARHGITLSQMRVLVTLYYSQRGVYSLKELEGIFHFSQQTIAGIVFRLEKKGLLERAVDKQDRRVKKVRITERGSALAEKAQHEVMERERRLLECLSEEEQEIFKQLLLKVNEHCR